MACRYPDARSPGELWENVLAQRRAFRRIPPERLRLDDYFSADRSAPDSHLRDRGGASSKATSSTACASASRAAPSAPPTSRTGSRSTSRPQALADAGLPDGEGLPREATGVFVGNTLTGEFSRANMLRLRWPYVRRVVDHALEQEALADGAAARVPRRP